MKRQTLFAALAGGLLAVILIMASVLFVMHRSAGPIAKPILKKVGFTVYAPASKEDVWQVAQNGTSYDARSGALTVNLVSKADGKMVMNQQNQPDTFTDIPGYYEKLLQSLNQYSIIHVGLGTFTLTHPTELKGGQTAVGLINGTLMFIHPDKNLSDTDWKAFLATLQRVN